MRVVRAPAIHTFGRLKGHLFCFLLLILIAAAVLVTVDQAKRMKELERENVRLKRLVADLSLEKQILKDVAAGNL